MSEKNIKGNPIVIYLTSNFKTLINFKNGAPSNLNVVLVACYNTYTKDYYIIDPTYKNGTYEYN